MKSTVGKRTERNHGNNADGESVGARSYSLLIKLLLLVVLVAFLFAVYRYNDAANVGMDKIDSGFKSSSDLSEFEECDARELKQFIGLEPSEYDSFVYYKGKESLSVDELLVIKANRRSDVDLLRDAVEARVSSQIKAFESYGPEQVKRLKNSVITARGKYLFYCVAKSPGDYEEVFRDVI